MHKEGYSCTCSRDRQRGAISRPGKVLLTGSLRRKYLVARQNDPVTNSICLLHVFACPEAEHCGLPELVVVTHQVFG